MSNRVLLLVAVVGALLVGGATTGTTLATWRDQAAAGSGTVQSGTFELDINGGGTTTAISLGTLPTLALNSGATAGAAQAQSATLNYTVTGKNNQMQLALTGITANQADLVSGLEVAASMVTTATTCPTPAGTYKPLSSYTSTALGTLANSAGSRKLCLSTRVKGSAPAAVAGKSGALTLTLTATQVRP